MNFFVEKICTRAIQVCSFSILCIPLVVISHTLYPYVFPKVIFFHILVEIAFLFWIPLLFLKKKYHPPLAHPFIAALSLYIAFLVVTALTGVDPYRSFFSTQERMTGVFTILHLYVWFLILISVFKTRKQWKTYVLLTIGIAFCVAVFGYVRQDNPALRISSTLGNALFFGSYILLHIFLTVFLIQKEAYTRAKRIFFFLILFVFIFSLFFSGSRMMAVSFLFGACVYVAIYIRFHFSQRIKNVSIGFFLCTAAFVGSLLFINVSFDGNAIAKKHLPYPLQRVFLFEEYQKSQGARLEAWRMGLEGWKERPMFGWGPENYPYIFQKHYRQAIVDEGERYADRSHNQYIDILALSGIMGFLLYGVFFGVLFLLLIRTIRKKNTISARLAGTSLAILFLVYLLQNITSFDSPALLIALFFSFGLAYRFISEDGDTKKVSDTKNNMWTFPLIQKLFLILSTGGIVFSLYTWNITPLVKNWEAYGAIRAIRQQGLNEKIVSQMQHTLASDSFTNHEIRLVFGKILYDAYHERRAQSKDIARQAVSYAIMELDKNIQSRPLDVKNYFSQIFLYRLLAPYDGDMSEKIEQRMQTAYALAPNRPEIYREFPQLYVAMQDFSKAQYWTRKGMEHGIAPRETHWQLAGIFLQKGEIDQGLEALGKAEQLGYPVFENENMAILLSKKLPDGQKNPSALHYIDRMVEAHPNDTLLRDAHTEARRKAQGK